jgi:hypothetical protein
MKKRNIRVRAQVARAFRPNETTTPRKSDSGNITELTPYLKFGKLLKKSKHQKKSEILNYFLFRKKYGKK